MPRLTVLKRGFGCAALCLAAAGTAGAQDTPYAVSMTPIEDAALRQGLIDSANLITLEREAPPSAIGLVRRAEADRSRLIAALRSLGYYDGTVTILVDGRPVPDLALVETLQANGGGRTIPVTILIEPGQPYTIARIAAVSADPLQPLTAQADLEEIGIATGDPARAGTILAAEAVLVRQMQEQGYPFARVPDRDAVVDHATRTMDVTFKLDPGRAAIFGPVYIRGLERTREDFVRRQIGFRPGDPYLPRDIDTLRSRLVDLGLFSSVTIRPAEEIGPDGLLPVTITVVERSPRTIGFGADLSSADGFAARAYWTHRNLFGRAENLRVEGRIAGLGSSDIDVFDYGLDLAFRKPDYLVLDQDLVLNAGIISEHPDAYSRDAVTLSAGLERQLSERLTIGGLIELEVGTLERNDEKQDFGLLALPLTLTYDSTDAPLDPTEGLRLRLEATPTLGFTGDASPFLSLRASGSIYEDFGTDGRYVLAARGRAGSIIGAGLDAVPFSRRFFSGGGDSVRGYAHQMVGPLDDDGDPTGGRSLLELGAELRIRIGEDWGVVPFVDAGGVFDSSFPDFSEPIQVAAGIGVRYYTGFGPVRVDVAVPLNPRDDDIPVGLYVSLGQAF